MGWLVALGCFIAVATWLAIYAVWLASLPPLEGPVGVWRCRSTGLEYAAEILPGGFQVNLTGGGETWMTNRDHFCRDFDRAD